MADKATALKQMLLSPTELIGRSLVEYGRNKPNGVYREQYLELHRKYWAYWSYVHPGCVVKDPVPEES